MSDLIDLAIAKQPTKMGRFSVPLSSGRSVVVEAPLDLTVGEFKEFIGEAAVNLGPAIVEAFVQAAKPQILRAASLPGH